MCRLRPSKFPGPWGGTGRLLAGPVNLRDQGGGWLVVGLPHISPRFAVLAHGLWRWDV